MGNFNELRILVAEDQYFVAREIDHHLKGEGAIVVGPFATIDAASNELKNGRVDVAVLDIALRDGLAFELARSCMRRGVPILFVTGVPVENLPDEFADVTVLEKPFSELSFIEALSAARSRPEVGDRNVG